jgi:EmrB/QacA subfamily drug resistance transporter
MFAETNMHARTQPVVRPNLILGICCLSLLMVGMDVTIVNVALPAIQREFHASVSRLQWLMDAYTLVVASLLMLAGSTADRLGRRRIFQTGMALFTLASLLCSLAPGINSLIAFRAIQGMGASMLNPVAMSIITNTFQEPKARARAIGVWGAMAGLAFAIGPLLGGALTQFIGWRSIFWINLPIGISAMLLAARFVPESKAAKPRAVDPIGQFLVLVGLASLTYAIIEGPHSGWNSAGIESSFAVSIIAIVSLIFYERRRTDPLLDLRFFHSVPFSSATVIAVCAFSVFAAFLLLNALYLQQVRGFSPLISGLCTLPLAFMTILCAPLSGRLVGAYGTRPSLLLAGVATLIGALLLTRLAADTPVPMLLLTYVVYGAGFAIVNIPITHTAVSGMPKSQAGVAAAIASTSRQVGAGLGIAVAGAIVGVRQAHGLSFTQATHAVWWLMAACGTIISLLGWASNTPWAKQTTHRVAHLLTDHAVEPPTN